MPASPEGPSQIRRGSSVPSTLRIYYVGGHRVEQVRQPHGACLCTCDCAEYLHGRVQGGQHWCEHVERVAAAAELDRLFRTPGVFVSGASY